MQDLTDGDVTDNEVVCTYAAGGYGIQLQGTLNRVSVSRNRIHLIAGHGIIVQNDAATGNTDLDIDQNFLHDETSGYGIQVECVGSSAYVKARDNRFGDTFAVAVGAYSDTSATPASLFRGVRGADANGATYYLPYTVNSTPLY